MKLALGGKRGEGQFARVDPDHFELVSQFKWHVNSGGYASCKSQGLMHRYIVNLIRNDLRDDPDLIVDHLDGNRLNNTSANLVPKTLKGNAKNRTNDPLFQNLTGVIILSSNGESVVFATQHRNLICYTSLDARMCALCYDSIVTYCYGPGKRINDLKSEKPLDISYWKLTEDVMIQLKSFRDRHTDFIGVKKSKNGWRAKITIDLGEFKTDVEAAAAYDRALKSVYPNPKPSQLNFK